MQKMQQIRIGKHGDTAIIGGGAKQRHVVQSLHALGKEVVTGHCECTSLIGPLLGGGHSTLQGKWGFVSDGLVSAQVVLANGTAITASATQHPDLFWALRGAGHNFGIVTSFEVKAYDLPSKKWTIATLVYTQDRLESFLEALNEVDAGGDHTPELILLGGVIRRPSFDEHNPVISYQVSYLGTIEEASPYIQRFRQAGPLSVTIATEVEHNNYSTATNSGVDSPACRRNLNVFTAPISLPTYNKTAMRVAFGHFRDLTADARFNTSAWLLQGYGSRGVRAQDYSKSAVPADERDMGILTGVSTWWSGDKLSDRKTAEKYGRMMQDALAAGASRTIKSPHVYLNYATGSESLEQVYGREKLQKLRVLKKRFDPLNRFGFYMPIS